MSTQVGGDPVCGQQWPQVFDQAAGGSVFSNGPDGVVASHQNVVLLGCCQLFFEPGQLTAGHSQVAGHRGLLTTEVIRVATQHHCVQHEDGHSYICPWNFEVQTVVKAWEVPVEGKEIVGKHFRQEHTKISSGQRTSCFFVFYFLNLKNISF